jgi:hypothetical protein
LRMNANGSKSTHITFTTWRGTCPPSSHQQCPTPSNRRGQYLGLHLDRRLAWHKHIFTKWKQLDIALTKMYWLFGRKSNLYKQQTPHLKNYTETNLGLWNTTLENRIHVQHRNTRMLPVKGSAHDNGYTMVCAEYANTEGSPNPNS